MVCIGSGYEKDEYLGDARADDFSSARVVDGCD